jgi:uncharacterized protein (TIGR02466 family)
MSAEPRMQFNGIWPTLLIRRRLPEFEQPTEALAAYITEMEAREADLTVRFREQSFFASTLPAVQWLKGHVEQTAEAFLKQVGVQRTIAWTLMGWCNTNRYGDHHAPHTHPGAYLSGTYYVRVPGGAISFFDPRTGANMVTAGGEPDARPTHTMQPSEGTLLMWPSPLQHQVHPNLSEAPRMSISFNLKPARRN